MARRVLEIQFIGDPSSARRAFAQVGRDASFLERRLGVVGAAANRVGGQLATLARRAVLPATAAAGASVKLAVDFDKSMRNVNSIAQLSEREFEKLEGRVLSLAGPTAQAPKTLAEGLYDLVSSGFDSGDSLKILEEAARAATAGLTSTEVSTAAVAAVLNAYRKPASEAGKVSDILFRTVDRGVISFEELASTIGDVLPFASSLGVGLEEVGAATATMTKAGIPAPETMTRIKNVMVSLLKPGEDLKKKIKDLGYESGEALVQEKGLQGALELLVGATDGSKQAVAGLFPNIRALGGVLALTGDNADGAGKDLEGMRDSAGATKRALEQQSKSVAFQWEQLKAQASTLAIEFGENLLPAIQDVMDVVADPKLDAGDKLSRVLEMALDAAEDALPHAIELGKDVAAALGEGFIDAWHDASPLEKVLIGGAAIRLLGGRGALLATGAGIGKWLGIGVARGAAAGAGAAAGGRGAAAAAGAAGGGIAGSIGRALRSVKWARVGALAVAIPLAQGIFDELGDKAESETEDLFDRLDQLAKDGGKNLGETITEGVAKAFTFNLLEFDSEIEADRVKTAAEEIQRALGRVERGAAISADEAQRLTDLLHSLPDVSPVAEQQGQELIDFGKDLGDLRDAFERTYNLKDVREAFTSELRTIRANWGRGTAETKELSRAAYRAMARHVGDMVRDGRISLGDARQYLRRFGGSVEDLGEEFRPMSRKAREAFLDVSHNSSKMRRDASEQFDRMSDNARAAFHRTSEDAERQLNKLPRIMDRALDATRKRTDEGGLEIRQSLLKQLRDYGISDPEGFIRRHDAVTDKDSFAGKRQGGEILQVPGAGVGDIVRTALPPGSFVVNRTAARAFGFQSGGAVPVRLEPGELVFPPELAELGQMMNDAVPRRDGGPIPRRRGGGKIVELLHPFNDPAHASPNQHLHIAMNSSAAVVALGRKLQKMGWLVTEHPAFPPFNPGGHSQTGYHPIGQAIDVNWPVGDVNGPIERAKIRALLPMLNRLAAGKGGVGGFGTPDIKLPRFVGRGLVGVQGAAGLNKMAAGLERVMGRRLAVEGAETVSVGEGGVGKGALRSAWVRAGGPADLSNIAAAIALAESGGRINARNVNDNGSVDLGPWQINSVHGFPERQLLTLMGNARAAVQVWRDAGGFTPWVQYNNGTYRQFLARGGLVRGLRRVRTGFLRSGGKVGNNRKGRGGKGGGKNPGNRGGGKGSTNLTGHNVGNLPPLSLEDLLILNQIELTEAGETEAFDDDLAALTERERLLEKQRRRIERRLQKRGLTTEKRTELLQELSSLTSELASVREDMASGNDATQELIQVMEAQTQELKALKDAIAEQNALISSTQQIHATELLRALSDLISGELGGRVFRSSLSAGTGKVVNA